RELDFVSEATRHTRSTAALDGAEPQAESALAAEQGWEVDRKARRKAARQASQRVEAASQFELGPKEEDMPTGPAVKSGADAELADGASQSRAATTIPRSASFGRLVHALLLVQPTNSDALFTTARTLAPQFGLKDEDAAAAAAADLAFRARVLPEISAVDTADLIYRAVPFAVPMGHGVLATGQIDLAYRKAGEWTVIDFKTADFPDRDAAIQAHGAQIAVYREALKKVTGGVPRSALWLIRSGRLLD